MNPEKKGVTKFNGSNGTAVVRLLYKSAVQEKQQQQQRTQVLLTVLCVSKLLQLKSMTSTTTSTAKNNRHLNQAKVFLNCPLTFFLFYFISALSPSLSTDSLIERVSASESGVAEFYY